MSADDIAVLRIELIDIEPLIWRRVAVPTATNLQTLHRIVQAAMGWQDYHLWEFTADDKTYGVPDPDDAGWGHKVYRASSATLARLVESGVTAFDYTYDMGDNWEHRITIERVEPAEPGRLYPDFLGGERRCPPEDSALLNFNVSDWLHDAAEKALSPEMLEMLVLQFGVIAAMFAVAWVLRLITCGHTDRLAARVVHYIPAAIRITGLGRIVTLAYAWLLLVITERVLARSGYVLTYVYVCVGCRFLPPRGHLLAGSKLSHTCFGRFREP